MARDGITARVVVGLSALSADVDAALWAADYAERCGCCLAVAHTSGQTASAHDLAVRLRAGSANLDVSTRLVLEPLAQGLAAASRTADLIVLGPPAGAEPSAPARALTARARCPVVTVPSGAARDGDLPVVVGTDGGRLTEAAVPAGFVLATALGTGMRVVCCLGAPTTGPRPAPLARAAFAVTDSCAERYPDVPVDVRGARSHAVTGLIRHARLRRRWSSARTRGATTPPQFRSGGPGRPAGARPPRPRGGTGLRTSNTPVR